MDDLMKLVIGWTLVGAFVFTVAMTCLSLVGWIKFAEKKQQQRLFQIVIVELVVGAGAGLSGFARYNPAPVKSEIRQAGVNEAAIGSLNELLTTDATAAPTITKKQAETLVGMVRARPGTALAVERDALQQKISALPAGAISPQDATAVRALPVFTTVKPTLFRPR
jgi:hypothetical protein